MPSSYSNNYQIELMETGANASTWGTNTNNNWNVVEAFTSGYLSKNISAAGNVTLTSAASDATAEVSNKVIELTGTITGNKYVFLPAVESNYIFYNNTSGSYTVSIACTGHSANSVTITQGSHTIVYSTGTSCSDFFSGNVGSSSTFYIGDGSSLTNIEPFAAGTKMVFQQTTAPTGWTKDTTHDKKVLRCVTGSASSGGSVTFADVFKNQTVSGTTGGTGVTITGSTAGHVLTQAQLPSVNLYTTKFFKTEQGADNKGSSSGSGGAYETAVIPLGGSDQSHSHGNGTLAGSSHTHSFSDTLDLAVEYVDLIIATKD